MTDDAQRERRLHEIRREAERTGSVASASIAISGSPIPPRADRTEGYYGLPMLKAPVWTWEVPAYFFVGGAAGAAAVIGAVARRTGADPSLVRDARWVAAVGGAVGISTGGSGSAGGSAPSSELNAATAAVSSAAGAGIAGGMARHRVWQRMQRTARPFAPIAASASW